MNNAGTIRSVTPKYAIAGGEIAIECDGFQLDADGAYGVYVNAVPCKIVAASPSRILAIVPVCPPGEANVHLETGTDASPSAETVIGEKIADEMHIVANPAVDPSDDAIIVTRSGSRGQQLPNTIYRIEKDGYIDELPDPIVNPSGIAFGPDGNMYVTNRAEGEVYVVSPSGINPVYATGLGIATGIAFDADGVMFVGDRSGTIYRVPKFGTVEEFATLEPSVAAYHLAFGPDGRLFVSAPGLASHDAIYAIDKNASVEKFAIGFGRPQGLAFDRQGNLYAAACHQGRHGIFRISPDGLTIEQFLAGPNIM
ncbi:MAG: gluconolaconase, partial [Acidobacteria bacterium]|nr:gluconolaconase [Acidobacteriota bacterium]